MHLFNCKGFYFLLKGKIGVTGNAKKRKYSFLSGNFSWTNKTLKMSFNKVDIRTHTGALGARFCITFI